MRRRRVWARGDAAKHTQVDAHGSSRCFICRVCDLLMCGLCDPFKHIQVDAPWTPKSFVGKTPQELVEEVYTCISKYVAYFRGQVSPAACWGGVNIHTYIYVCIYVHTFIFVGKTSQELFIWIHIYVHICTRIHLHVCIYKYACKYVYV